MNIENVTDEVWTNLCQSIDKVVDHYLFEHDLDMEVAIAALTVVRDSFQELNDIEAFNELEQKHGLPNE